MKWIKTTDKAIPIDEMVLMCLEVIRETEHYFDMFIAKVNLADGLLEDREGNDPGWSEEDIDYWMPLPDAPKE